MLVNQTAPIPSPHATTRPKISRPSVISQDEALRRILAHVQPLSPRAVELWQAVGSFAAEDVSARFASPPFDNSAMDGYAVVASFCTPGARLRIVGEQPAGLDRGLRMAAGEAIRILTGAPLPVGADAVVMQEDVRSEETEIVINERVEEGEFIRRRGGDVAEGQKILSRGERITAQIAALLAAQGFAETNVGGAARATIISTGDELAPAGAALQPGQIYDSNSVLLHALLTNCRAQIIRAEHCPDRAAEIEAAIRRALDSSDILILTGGVSVGARDLVKPALTAAGATLDLWRVAVKPGKPFLFGRAAQCLIFGLPGNPVSAFVTFQLLVRPALMKLMGAAEHHLLLPVVTAAIADAASNPGDRPHYLRGILRDGIFTLGGRQESHALFGLSRANALLQVQPRTTLAAGASASVLLLD